MRNLITIICLVILNATYSQNSTKNYVTVKISNLNSNKGKVYVGLYNSEENFLNKTYKGIVSQIENNSCNVVFKDLPDGVYAVSMYHDENNNNKMDKNLLGIPKEDYGCSNNAKGFMGPPKWEDAKFELKGESIKHHIKL